MGEAILLMQSRLFVEDTVPGEGLNGARVELQSFPHHRPRFGDFSFPRLPFLLFLDISLLIVSLLYRKPSVSIFHDELLYFSLFSHLPHLSYSEIPLTLPSFHEGFLGPSVDNSKLYRMSSLSALHPRKQLPEYASCYF